MSDFHQHGPITTLHRLSDSRLGELEQMLLAACAARRIVLVIPCHAEDVGRRPTARILDELATAGWLKEIVICANGFSSRDDLVCARRALASPGAQSARWLWCDGPNAISIRTALMHEGLLDPDAEPGKGWNVWLAMGFALAHANSDVIAVHDADIANYRREMLVRLCMPLVHGELNYTFAKGYYRRVTEGVMFGRVTRLLVAPLLRAAVRVFGHQPLLDHLTAFRFPLAGECAFTADVARELPIISGWGLELGWLCEVYRRVPPRQICQVELAANYDHKHRPLNAARGRAGLVDLAREIAHAFVSELHAEGLVLDAATAHALKLAFEKAAAEAAERHAHDALLNAMRHDAKAELLAVEAFAQVLAETLAGKPRGQFVLPAWNRVVAQSPQIADRLRELIVGD